MHTTTDAAVGLYNIATANNVTLDQVLYVNPAITNARFIDVGQIIAIPASTCVAPVATTEETEVIATCSNTTSPTYTVVSGDTMTIIALEKLGITLQALVDANTQITDIDVLAIGDVLNVPLCDAAVTTTSTAATPSATAKKSKSKSKAAGKSHAKAFQINGKTNYNGTASAKDCEAMEAIVLPSA